MTDVTVDAAPQAGKTGWLTPFNIITGIILAGGAIILGIRNFRVIQHVIAVIMPVKGFS